MKQILLLIAIISVAVVPVYSAGFTPTTMKLTAAPVINYQFDGKPLAIPVTVSGTPADISFCVFTRNQGSAVSMVTNGFLGWHHVNRIDTCMYVSPSNQMEPGTNTINWDGKDENGTPVPPGEYTYYLFGYDNRSEKVNVTQYIRVVPSWNGITFLEKDEDGKPLARPVIYELQGISGVVRKWNVGGDPTDIGLLETTRTKAEYTAGYMAVLPTDKSKLFIDGIKIPGIKATRKWKWIPNGNAILDTTWCVNGEYTYSGSWPELDWHKGPGVVSDGKDWLFLSDADQSPAGKESHLIIINATDGSEVKKLDLSKWWANLNDGEAGGQNCGGPIDIDYRNGLIDLGAHGTCINSVMDPYAEITDDAVLWVNRNGDYIGDHNWDPTSPRPWVCNDYNTHPYKYTTSMDDQGFVIFTATGYNVAGNSFGLYAPDGTGVAYKNIAGETKFGESLMNYFVDYGSAYDGIYITKGAQGKLWFVAHDSFMGIITNQTGFNETAPSSFSVTQNSPNPFNSSTTICFTIDKTGYTTVEVYNVGGQKVDTILKANLNSENHSVVWDADRFAAGVYFYMVRSGSFSGIRKMTLLK
ncbi:MAG: T9SS type A sorting domain-containing protein [Candidatus Latescibacteria bacterium]|nr:T9SS type A sorting domain-containing protein [Candidatus Latescibacterota bacterium]